MEKLVTETIAAAVCETHRPKRDLGRITVATTNRSIWIVASQLCEGNPYDGHSATETSTTVERVTHVAVADAHVHKGYQGHQHTGEAKAHIARQRKKNTARAERKRRRLRNTIEPKLDHLKGAIIGWVGAFG